MLHPDIVSQKYSSINEYAKKRFRSGAYLTTLTLHVTDFPSTVTVIVVVPVLRAVISPVDETDAVVADLDEYLAVMFVASAGFTIGMSW